MVMTQTAIVDVHSHMLEHEATAIGMRHSPATNFGKRIPDSKPGTAFAKAQSDSYEPEAHIAAMDELGIDAEILSSTTMLQGTSWADPEEELRLVRRINDAVAEWVERFPTRFIGSFVLPLLDRSNSERELLRCIEDLKFRVVQLPASVRGAYLGHPQFEYLWELVRDRGLVAFMHPDGTRDPWFQDYAMWNSIGQSIEEVKLLTSLIYEGVLERHAGVKIVVAHGGGFLPHNAARLDRNIRAWPESTRNIQRKPSEYLTDIFYDTCLYDPAVLEALVRRVGANRLVLGSDFPVGEADPLGFVRRCDLLTESDQTRVLGGTACELIGVAKVDGGGRGVSLVPAR